MNKEEAIKRIQGLVYCLRNSLREEQKEALDIAIKALQAKIDDDLISRKDALEQIAQAECGLYYEDCEADNCACDYIWRILNIPSTESKTNEWIPVSEGLPKKNDDYLVTVLIPIQDYNNVYYEESDIMFLSFHHGKFFDEFDTTDYHNFVTAWMPKPKPYKGSDKE